MDKVTAVVHDRIGKKRHAIFLVKYPESNHFP
jgi:hypothetical protein